MIFLWPHKQAAHLWWLRGPRKDWMVPLIPWLLFAVAVIILVSHAPKLFAKRPLTP